MIVYLSAVNPHVDRKKMWTLAFFPRSRPIKALTVSVHHSDSVRREVLSGVWMDSKCRLSSFGFLAGTSFLLRLFTTPSSSSIMRRIFSWSEELIGATEMSRTARNLPQLFRCSFSSRKKFHTKRLWNGVGIPYSTIIWIVRFSQINF